MSQPMLLDGNDSSANHNNEESYSKNLCARKCTFLSFIRIRVGGRGFLSLSHVHQNPGGALLYFEEV